MQRRQRWRPDLVPLPLALVLLVLLALLAPLGPAGAVRAHSGGLGAFVTLDPAQPEPGRATRLLLEVVDAYNNPVPGLTARAAVAQGGGRPAPPVALQDLGEGRYQGELLFASPGKWQIELVVLAGQWRYLGRVPVVVGEGGHPVADLGLVLEPVEDGLGHSGGLWLAGAGAFALLVLAGLALWWRRRRQP